MAPERQGLATSLPPISRIQDTPASGIRGCRDTEAQGAEGREDPGCGAARTRGCPGSVLSGSVALS